MESILNFLLILNFSQILLGKVVSFFLNKTRSFIKVSISFSFVTYFTLSVKKQAHTKSSCACKDNVQTD